MDEAENTCGDLRCHRLYAGEFPNVGVCGAPCGPQSQCNDYSGDEYGDFSAHQCVAGRCVGPENPGHSEYTEEPDVTDAGPVDDDAGVLPVEIVTFDVTFSPPVGAYWDLLQWAEFRLRDAELQWFAHFLVDGDSVEGDGICD